MEKSKIKLSELKEMYEIEDDTSQNLSTDSGGIKSKNDGYSEETEIEIEYQEKKLEEEFDNE